MNADGSGQTDLTGGLNETGTAAGLVSRRDEDRVRLQRLHGAERPRHLRHERRRDGRHTDRTPRPRRRPRPELAAGRRAGRLPAPEERDRRCASRWCPPTSSARRPTARMGHRSTPDPATRRCSSRVSSPWARPTWPERPAGERERLRQLQAWSRASRAGVDDSDVQFTFQLTDVRRQGTLADYTGELQATTVVRITDRVGGPANRAGHGHRPRVPGDGSLHRDRRPALGGRDLRGHDQLRRGDARRDPRGQALGLAARPGAGQRRRPGRDSPPPRPTRCSPFRASSFPDHATIFPEQDAFRSTLRRATLWCFAPAGRPRPLRRTRRGLR